MDAVTALTGGVLRPLAMSGSQQDETPASRADAEFDTLYHPQARRVLQTCRYLLGSPDEAEDAAQEVFLRARQRFEQYDRVRPFASWILGVASHHCIDRLRRRGREARLFGAEGRRTGGGARTPARPADGAAGAGAGPAGAPGRRRVAGQVPRAAGACLFPRARLCRDRGDPGNRARSRRRARVSREATVAADAERAGWEEPMTCLDEPTLMLLADEEARRVGGGPRAGPRRGLRALPGASRGSAHRADPARAGAGRGCARRIERLPGRGGPACRRCRVRWSLAGSGAAGGRGIRRRGRGGVAGGRFRRVAGSAFPGMGQSLSSFRPPDLAVHRHDAGRRRSLRRTAAHVDGERGRPDRCGAAPAVSRRARPLPRRAAGGTAGRAGDRARRRGRSRGGVRGQDVGRRRGGPGRRDDRRHARGPGTAGDRRRRRDRRRHRRRPERRHPRHGARQRDRVGAVRGPARRRRGFVVRVRPVRHRTRSGGRQRLCVLTGHASRRGQSHRRRDRQLQQYADRRGQCRPRRAGCRVPRRRHRRGAGERRRRRPSRHRGTTESHRRDADRAGSRCERPADRSGRDARCGADGRSCGWRELAEPVPDRIVLPPPGDPAVRGLPGGLAAAVGGPGRRGGPVRDARNGAEGRPASDSCARSPRPSPRSSPV